MRVVFVCTGNTCRSPMAEAIFRFYAKESGVKADVSSYGLFINPEECETRGQALIAVRKLNIPIRKKKSKVITEDVVKNADYVVTMTKKQKTHCRTTTFLLFRNSWEAAIFPIRTDLTRTHTT